MEKLNYYLEIASHPFFMTISGLVFWFLLKWSVNRNKEGFENGPWWHDQKDELIVCLIGGLMFVIWDDEILKIYYEVLLKQPEHAEEMQSYYYLLVGFAMDQIYKIISKLM